MYMKMYILGAVTGSPIPIVLDGIYHIKLRDMSAS